MDRCNFVLLVEAYMRMLSAQGGALAMPAFEGDYDFVEAGNFDRSFTDLDTKLQIEEYRDLARAFIASTNRLIAFHELPLQLIYWSGVLSVTKMRGRHRAGVSPEDESHDAEEKVQKAIYDVYAAQTSNIDSRVALARSAAALGVMLGDRGTSGVTPAQEGIEAALAAMVMTAYANFETLAADLWVCAVNRHTILASNWGDKNKDKQITMAEMIGQGWDLSKSAGSVLHRTRRVSFDSLNDIRTHYTQAFKGSLGDVFLDYGELVKAEKTRHLFAHRGGLADKKFKDEMASFDEYKTIVPGDRLRLTGPVSGRHINACVTFAVSLLRAVDEWSTNEAK